MTKAELVAKIAGETKVSKAAAEKVLNSAIKNVTMALKKGDKITLTGFGTFSVSKRKARKGRNPQTGAAIRIKATKVPKFSPGKGLKDAVSGKK
ncbi:MAG: DNA-binding protein HU [Deltaproteobacteria bacterium]|nr:DNA-binding protein HU [Deltaproteobacteria bacterium]NIS76190.1 DNA-binding protein HU [Deltaproteobacteria bacterium]